MFKAEYDQIVRENFDLSDRNTRRYIATLEDAGQEQLLSALSSALYDKIVTKVDDIDFGTIPMSRGDITKVEGFAGTEECLRMIRRLVVEYKQNPAVVDVVLSAIQNVKDRKALFIKAYTLNVELPMLIYNCVVLSIVRSTSLMIATCIQYIKDPTSSSPKAALDKVAYQRTMDDMLFKQLISFNNMCSNGSLDKVLNTVMKYPVKEEVEFQYGTMTPIVEEDPQPENGDDVVENPIQGSPFEPDNTIEPGGTDPIAPTAEPQEPEVPETDNELTGDTDIPAANEFPEDVPDTATDEEDDIDPDTEIDTVPDEANNDGTEPDNIPSVVPGDDVSSTDAPINETDDKTEEAPKEEEVEEVAVTATTAAIFAGKALGAAIIATAGVKLAPIVLNVIIKGLREVVYVSYYSRLKFSDCLSVQADFMEANANELQYSTSSTLSEDEKKKVIKKQIKWVERLRNWSNKFAIDNKQAQTKAQKDVSSEDKNKHTIKKNEYNEDSIW